MKPHVEEYHNKNDQFTEIKPLNILLNKEFIDAFTRIIFPPKK